MTRPLHLVIAISLIASAVASTAYGHARLKSPQPRDNQDGYKDPPRTPPGTGAPCGISEAASQPHNNLLVSILNLFGLPNTTFGHAKYNTGALTGLT